MSQDCLAKVWLNMSVNMRFGKRRGKKVAGETTGGSFKYFIKKSKTNSNH